MRYNAKCFISRRSTLLYLGGGVPRLTALAKISLPLTPPLRHGFSRTYSPWLFWRIGIGGIATVVYLSGSAWRARRLLRKLSRHIVCLGRSITRSCDLRDGESIGGALSRILDEL